MFCGSCMHDNALAKSLSQIGYDIQLVPTYTPIRTDESNFSVDQVFFGGINVYLQQKFPPLRWLPGFLDRFLDNPKLIRRVTSRSMDMPAEQLGQLAVSMLKGMNGNQRKEVLRLCRWLKETAQPEVVVFTNALIGGCIPEIKKQLGKPVLVTLQGDDVFLDSLPDTYRKKCIAAIQETAQLVDGFMVHTEFFKSYMADYFNLPSEKIHVTPLGIDTQTFAQSKTKLDELSPTIGYLARFAPEKGFHKLIDAFIELKQRRAVPGLQLRIGGWLGSENEHYFNEQMHRLPNEFKSDVDYVGSIERDEKVEFLSTIDVLSVPTVFKEPKGLYALEAMACAVPVVQPNHGAFPELIEASRGGILFAAGDTEAHCEALIQVLTSRELRNELGKNAKAFVTNHRNAQSMGKATAYVIERMQTR